jgi:proprotein convertase subtilisin/kexin type 5
MPGCVACASKTVCAKCQSGIELNADQFGCGGCAVRFYFDSSSCQSCPFDCLTCDPDQNCLSCSADIDFRTLIGSRCVPLPGYYESNQTVAAACPTECENCSSSSNCTSCIYNYHLENGKCIKNGCPVRTFDYYGNCTACPYDCYSCNPQQFCLSCNATTDFRELSGVRCVPLPGYFESGTRVASACPAGCSACSSASFCTACS